MVQDLFPTLDSLPIVLNIETSLAEIKTSLKSLKPNQSLLLFDQNGNRFAAEITVPSILLVDETSIVTGGDLLSSEHKYPVLPVPMLPNSDNNTGKDIFRVFFTTLVDSVFLRDNSESSQVARSVSRQQVLSQLILLVPDALSASASSLSPKSTPTTIWESELLVSALRIMTLTNMPLLSVVKADGSFLGTVSLHQIHASGFEKASELLQKPVADFIAAYPAQAVSPDTSLKSIADILIKQNADHVNVVDEGKYVSSVGLKELLIQLGKV